MSKENEAKQKENLMKYNNKTNNIMENKYKEGEFVYAKTNPNLKLIIRRYVDRIYYCKIFEDLNRKDLAYFERELLPWSKESS